MATPAVAVCDAGPREPRRCDRAAGCDTVGGVRGGGGAGCRGSGLAWPVRSPEDSAPLGCPVLRCWPPAGLAGSCGGSSLDGRCPCPASPVLRVSRVALAMAMQDAAAVACAGMWFVGNQVFMCSVGGCGCGLVVLTGSVLVVF